MGTDTRRAAETEPYPEREATEPAAPAERPPEDELAAEERRRNVYRIL